MFIRSMQFTYLEENWFQSNSRKTKMKIAEIKAVMMNTWRHEKLNFGIFGVATQNSWYYKYSEGTSWNYDSEFTNNK